MKSCFLLLLQLLWVLNGSRAQRSSYSLQAAVDELHRREAAKYPLNAPPPQRHYFGSAFGTVPDQDYWDVDPEHTTNTNNQNHDHHRLNKALAKFLERENFETGRNGLSLEPFSGYEFDEDSNNIYSGYTDKSKRSSYFRERDSSFDENPATVFRERDAQISNDPKQAELTEQFLREIEETQNHDRQERYKEALRHLWEKYQQQENQIQSDLFEEKKRMRTPPYYMLMQKKRSYPVLPWLPYSADREKRFPVAKRSTVRFSNENTNMGKTDEKVTRELSELFGTTSDDKKKRSTDDKLQVLATHAPAVASTLSSDIHLEIPVKKRNTTESSTKFAPVVKDGSHNPHNHAEHLEHAQKEYKHRKRSDHTGSHESHEEDEDSEEAEDEEDMEEEHEDFEDDDDDSQKKKRDIVGVNGFKGELLRIDHLQPNDLRNLRKKKSIQWSKYFGLDRKKKSLKKDELEVKKRSTNTENIENYDNNKKSSDLDPEKLESMDKKLQSIEDFIIDETIKYTGAHEGTTSPEEIRHLKDQVLSRLATAYSLEKMRRALEKLRRTVDAENHLLRNVIEPINRNENIDNIETHKRLSVKKETSDLHEPTKTLSSNAMMTSATGTLEHNKDINNKQKKKRNGYLRYPELPNGFYDFEDDVGGAGRYEPLNDAYLGNKNYIVGSNQCPLIESMAERCRGVDLLSGDINQELLPICGIHQICYLCGTSQIACDYQYLTEADSICENNDDCQAAARSVLLILRGTPGPQLGPKRCLKNTCLYSAMREIGL